jgi:hypothetical protein
MPRAFSALCFSSKHVNSPGQTQHRTKMGQQSSSFQSHNLPPVDSSTAQIRLLKVLAAESIYDVVVCEFIVRQTCELLPRTEVDPNLGV